MSYTLPSAGWRTAGHGWFRNSPPFWDKKRVAKNNPDSKQRNGFLMRKTSGVAAATPRAAAMEVLLRQKKRHVKI
jgi:hypothetical protein